MPTRLAWQIGQGDALDGVASNRTEQRARVAKADSQRRKQSAKDDYKAQKRNNGGRGDQAARGGGRGGRDGGRGAFLKRILFN